MEDVSRGSEVGSPGQSEGSRGGRRAAKLPRNKRPRDPTLGTTCKTCVHCRKKKVKCDGTRPNCRACTASDVDCVYPQDTRRLLRRPNSRVLDLEQQIVDLWEQINASRQEGEERQTGQPSPFPDIFSGKTPGQQLEHNGGHSEQLPDTPVMAERTPYRPPPWQSPGPTESRIAVPKAPSIGDSTYSALRDHVNENAASPLSKRPPTNAALRPQDQGAGSPQSNLSPCEAQIAGLDVGHDGKVSVHGATSMMHRRVGNRTANRDSSFDESSQAAIQAQLVGYAAIQRQREAYAYRHPPSTMDLDGVDLELARHLLDLHWNRQHFAYLLTYRPAVMDSLINGGRWCNKLLLNAMYYTSSLYSDRTCLRTSPEDTQSAGDKFYQRIRVLLVEEMERPSIPTAAGLLLAGAALVSQGRSSAGWIMCGIAYRMVIDLGLHLTNDSHHPAPSTAYDINIDIEKEWRRRLYWGALITDATQSLYLGRQMTLRPTDGRVPQLFLDSYEELEEWSPYIDTVQRSSSHDTLVNYVSQPAYATSTFNALIGLAQLSARITGTFYNINYIKSSRLDLKAEKIDIEAQLRTWRSSLPDHLRYEPGVDPVPPPHQITPHTTSHSLNILLQRPFLDGGYLQATIDEAERKASEQSCIESALAIWKLVSAYRDGLTLRRTPFLLSFAVYSAVVVILRQSKSDPERFREPISFFWTALSELQRGCNFGLRKPVAILREMVNELGSSIPQPQDHPENELAFSRMMEICAFGNGAPGTASAGGLESDTYHPHAFFDPLPLGELDFPNDQELTITNDTLYGLFAHQSTFF
ncbi:hypothetical protein GQ53DRAFT_884761 [Thozetella sp. PMI_491]|nr:hypothetical protein GQ53DRAFT_884761 [Thozetella sp. PMI_491]